MNVRAPGQHLLGAEWRVRVVFSDSAPESPDRDSPPVLSSVLYVNDTGGGTAIGLDGPILASEYPEANKYMIFPGQARHGVLPVNEAGARRVVLLDWWTRRPANMHSEPLLGETP